MLLSLRTLSCLVRALIRRGTWFSGTGGVARKRQFLRAASRRREGFHARDRRRHYGQNSASDQHALAQLGGVACVLIVFHPYATLSATRFTSWRQRSRNRASRRCTGWFTSNSKPETRNTKHETRTLNPKSETETRCTRGWRSPLPSTSLVVPCLSFSLSLTVSLTHTLSILPSRPLQCVCTYIAGECQR
jgi:hypothetical protein